MEKNNIKNGVFTTCDLCGKEISTKSDMVISDYLINSGDNIHICYNCISGYYREMTHANQKRQKLMTKSNGEASHKIKPSAIKAYLDDYIIGQEKAKKVLSVAIYNHYKMIKIKQESKDNSVGKELEKSNILMLGPSGCGKTAMVKRLAKKLDVPFIICDATAYTAAGYVGKDVETILRNLINATGKSGKDAIKAAERGIVYIDEIDKISRKGENLSTTSDPGNEAVQQGLLKLLEGSTVTVPLNSERLHPNAESAEINTENILFIVGGAFEDIEKIISQRKWQRNKIGFGSVIVDDNKKDDYNELILDVNTEDLKKFGMLPEFLGRVPVICPMQKLNEDALIEILTKPKNSIINQYKELLWHDNIRLEFTDEALHKIAKEAIKTGTGARSLRGVVENIMNDIMYDIPDHDDIKYVYIDVEDNKFKTITRNNETRKEVVANG